jgi:hypothetical protein
VEPRRWRQVVDGALHEAHARGEARRLALARASASMSAEGSTP